MSKTYSPVQQAHVDLVRKHLKRGDLITHTRCMGLLEEHIFAETRGHWLCGTATPDTRRMARMEGKVHGATGFADDISPLNVTHINRVPVDALDFIAPQKPKQPRVRVAQCLHCRGLFRWQRRTPGDEVHVQVCQHCYHAHDAAQIPSTLEDPATHPNLK